MSQVDSENTTGAYRLTRQQAKRVRALQDVRRLRREARAEIEGLDGTPSGPFKCVLGTKSEIEVETRVGGGGLAGTKNLEVDGDFEPSLASSNHVAPPTRRKLAGRRLRRARAGPCRIRHR